MKMLMKFASSRLLFFMMAIFLVTSCTKEEKGNSTITGVILNSQTGLGVAGADVGFTKDLSVTDVENTNHRATTDALGKFTLENAPAGTFRMIVDAPGYFVRIIDNVEIVDGMNDLGDFTSVAPPSEGSLRIILSWGELPEDIDSHITGPDGYGDRFHVYFGNQSSWNGEVELDVDDVWSYGPETVTINTFFDGVYRYSVHNYDDQSLTGCQGIFDSPAKVEIYNSEGLLNVFIAPAASGQTGNTWQVFEINVSDDLYTIDPINEYVYFDYASVVTK